MSPKLFIQHDNTSMSPASCIRTGILQVCSFLLPIGKFPLPQASILRRLWQRACATERRPSSCPRVQDTSRRSGIHIFSSPRFSCFIGRKSQALRCSELPLKVPWAASPSLLRTNGLLFAPGADWAPRWSEPKSCLGLVSCMRRPESRLSKAVVGFGLPRCHLSFPLLKLDVSSAFRMATLCESAGHAFLLVIVGFTAVIHIILVGVNYAPFARITACGIEQPFRVTPVILVVIASAKPLALRCHV